jgi:TRAP-type C4-dicarboxylate transport system permease small subunit
MHRLSGLYGRLLDALALAACVLLFFMMLVICADVLFRNVPLIPGVRGVSWGSDVTESGLYLLTMLTAPWLLRQGQHIRVDILLRAVPRTVAWVCEWATDIMALACCIVIANYGFKAMFASMKTGSMTIKTLVTPEWWSLAPLPVTFVLLAIEVVFRMHRLYGAERGPRDDAVSAS